VGDVRAHRPPSIGWPTRVAAYDLTRRARIRIDVACMVIEDRNRAEREMWGEVR
jgi:hypothetical protein